VARNWRCRLDDVRGEIDIIAERAGVLVICEVKTRTSTAFGGPAAAVGPQKQVRLRRLAVAYLTLHGGRGRAVRFDVAAVIDDAVEVIEAAF
jgi:putative endonuclease